MEASYPSPQAPPLYLHLPRWLSSDPSPQCLQSILSIGYCQPHRRPIFQFLLTPQFLFLNTPFLLPSTGRVSHLPQRSPSDKQVLLFRSSGPAPLSYIHFPSPAQLLMVESPSRALSLGCCPSHSFSGGARGKEPASQCRRLKRHRVDPRVGKILWRRKWQPTLGFLPGKSHGHRDLAGYSPRGHKE